MIRTDRLSVHYRGIPAVRDVSLELVPGEITAIVGPSGCGKSSLLAALNRLTDLIPGAEVHGAAWLGDMAIYDPSCDPSELRRRVGMIFQRPNPFPLSIRENLQLALREHRDHPRDQWDAVTEQVLRDVGLWEEVKDRLDRSALQLSGGQQQRLCLARALALEPQVLLLDEPCSALDPLATATIESLLAGFRDRYTVLIVTHNLAQARRLADRLLVFWPQQGVGQLLEQGPTAELFETPRNPTVAAYLTGAQG